MKLHYPLLVCSPQIHNAPNPQPHPKPAAQSPLARKPQHTHLEVRTGHAFRRAHIKRPREEQAASDVRKTHPNKPPRQLAASSFLPERGSITKLAEDAHIVAQIRVSDQDEMLLCTRDRNALASLVAEERLTTAVNNGRKHDGIELLALGRVN